MVTLPATTAPTKYAPTGSPPGLLINSTDYATTEAIYGPHPNVLAHELGVTVKALKTWQTLHERQVA